MFPVKEILASADLIVAVGSVDGVLTAAAVKRLGVLFGGNPDGAEVCFTQAFQVNSLPVGEWSDRRVVFVDLAVNNREPAMTAKFVEDLRAGGNTLLAIIDEHSREDWLGVLGSFDGLVVEPQTRDQSDLGTPQSSGEVLRRALQVGDEFGGTTVESYVYRLLDAADQADRMNFDTQFGEVVNKATKSNIGDNRRRVHLAGILSRREESDDQVDAWITEYEEMEANAASLLESAVVALGDGIVQVDTDGRKLDVTSFLFALYKRCRVAVITGTTAYDKAAGRSVPKAFVATGERGLDVLAIVKAAGIPSGGMPQKATIDLEGVDAAIAAIRAALVA